MNIRKILVSSGAFVAASLPAAAAAAVPGPTAIATYDGAVNVAADDGMVAVVAPHAGHGALLIGNGTTAPTAVDAGAVPTWALPHVGTDASGGVVVTYPRCASAAVTSCDLYAWSVSTSHESKVSGVNGSRTGEIEGVEDHGNVVVARALETHEDPGDLSIYGDPDERTTLVYRPAGGHRRVLSAPGGRQLALHGSRIAQVRNTYVAGDGGANDDAPTLELLSTTGGAARRVRKMVSGEAFQTFTAPTFVGNTLVAGVRWTDRRGYVLRDDLAKNAVTLSRASALFLTYVATSATSGVQLTATPVGTPTTSDIYTLSAVTR